MIFSLDFATLSCVYIWRFSNPSLYVTQGVKYGALNEERNHYSVAINLARKACYPLHHVKVP